MKKFIYIITYKTNPLSSKFNVIYDEKIEAMNMARYLKKKYGEYVEFDAYQKSTSELGSYKLMVEESVNIEEEVNK